MQEGIIFDIKEFAVHDGPGIRQTVFLKGCPLRCQWCHNPEGLGIAPQLMFSRSSCSGCGRCARVCPAPAIDSAGEGKAQDCLSSEGIRETAGPAPLTGHRCLSCGACAELCPLGLRQITGRRMTSGELTETIRENSDYYAAQGGGVTFSGGEPLLQGAFLLEVLEQIPDLHTAIETSGYAEASLFQSVIGKLSFVMMDVKLMDPKRHKQFTGVDNDPILRNLAFLRDSGRPFVARIPLIPGVNDTEENLEATARFLTGSTGLLRVELLPYHKTAGAKYSMLGMEYRPGFDTEASLQPHREIFEQYGIRSEIL